MTGTCLSKLFDVQQYHFLVISCTQCSYSELYNKESSQGSNLLDFFFVEKAVYMHPYSRHTF
ncbi:zinc ribbon domain-containing protein [Terribacillus sp. 179-K 1B1 HS]|uniref:zinc ribbon domain-containing protein n=1 Tax=Terribacillus sp. 179-K 1B1 HS TaxID=3142388 RepID=UPI00399FB664